MKKKWAVGGALAVLLPSLALAAPTGASASGPVVVRILFNDQGALADTLFEHAIGDAFMKSHPGIKLEWQFVPGNEIDSKTILGVNSGNPPNIVVVYQDVALLAQKGVLTPLSNWFQKSHIKPGAFVKASWQTVQVNGQPYAFPAASTPGYVLWYNPAAMRAAGLNPNDPPRTWAQLLADSKKAVKFGPGGKLERVGLEFADINYENFNGLFTGGQTFWKQTSQGWAPDPTNPANVGMLNYLKQLADLYGGYAKYSKFIASDQTWNGPIDYLAQGKALFRIGGYWDYPGLAQYSPKFKYGVTYAPTQNGLLSQQINHPVTQWAVAFPKGQNNAALQAAWQFAVWAFDTHSYMLGPTTNGSAILDQQKQWIQYTIKNMTPTQKWDAKYLHFATDVLPYAKDYWPSLPITSYYQAQLTNAADQVLYGKQTAQQALQTVQKNVQTQMVISG